MMAGRAIFRLSTYLLCGFAALSAGSVLADPMELRGRIELDAPLAGPADAPDTVQLRRLFLGVEGEFSRFAYVFDLDIANVDHNEIMLQDFQFTWNPEGATRVLVGHFRPPAIAEILTSDLDTVFLERSAYADLLSVGRLWGVAVEHMSGNWNLRVDFHGAHGSELVNGNFGTMALGAIRVHGNALGNGHGRKDTKADAAPVLHLGVSLLFGDRPDDGGFELMPETYFAPPMPETDPLRADHMLFTGVEVAFQRGTWLFQAEGGRTRLYGVESGNPNLYGWSAQIAWRPTGEVRPYDARKGVFDMVTPRRALDEGGAGAFELGARVGQTDLDSRYLRGGRLTSYSVVASWFPIRNVRLATDYVHAESKHVLAGNRDDDFVAVRAQYEW